VRDTPFSFPQHPAGKTPATGRFIRPVPQTGARAAPLSGVVVATCALQSLQRRFISQQVLETPLVTAGAASPQQHEEQGVIQEEDVDDFKIFSQPAYERVISQRQDLDLEQEDDGFTFHTQHPSQIAQTDAPLSEPVAVTLEADAGEPLLSQTAPAPSVARDGEEHHRHTPAVHSADRVQLNGADCGPVNVFPVFRSRKDLKTVYIIRHGESEYNEAISRRGTGFSDPLIFDAPLTAKGRRQAMSLRQQLAALNLPLNTVWVTSPLSRAIETLMLARPPMQRSPDENKHDGGDLMDWGDICILPEVTERALTASDIGRSPSDLADRFPELAAQLSKLQDVWWWCHPDDPGCAYRKILGKTEPKEHLRKRVAAFRKWILARPEKVFVAVGHSLYWKEFATVCKNGVKQQTLANCGYTVVHV
jgi:glucosyl-3-phosphoglycerate phosphatase